MSDANTGKKMVEEALGAKVDRKRSRRLARMSSSTAKPGLEEIKLLAIEQVAARKPGIVPHMWSPEEDEKLRNAISIHGDKNWRQVAKEIPGRTYIQCLQRWKKALRPGLVKGHWTKEEDAKLLKLVDYYAPNWDWNALSKKIPGRNAKQCRERWFLNLDPEINRGPWTQEEDSELLKYVSQWGSRWALIAKQLPGRTENSVKTRFHSLKRREARNRPWSAAEDSQIIEGVLKFGREFELVQKNMTDPSRTKGQIKKRFTILQQQRPDLMRQVYAVEDSIRQNGHLDQENRINPLAANKGMKRNESNPLDQIQNTLMKTDSQLLLSSLLDGGDKMEITSGDKKMGERNESTSSLSIPLPAGVVPAGVDNDDRRPKSFRRYNTSVELLNRILNDPNSDSLMKTETAAPPAGHFTQDPAILKRADSLFNEAFGNQKQHTLKVEPYSQDDSLKRVDSFLSALDINNNNNAEGTTGSYATPEKTQRLLKRASSSIGALLRLESSDMRSIINML